MISFVYFDVGGVVVKDFSKSDKWQQLRQELGVTSELEEAFQKIWQQYEPEICLGREVDSLVPILRRELNLQLPVEYSLLDGFVNRFEANPSLWPVIEMVKQKARVGLLTNMYPGMLEATQKRGIMPQVDWDVVVDSSLELFQKPDPKLFELAETQAGATGREVLFIDNTLGHVKAAKEFGWQICLYDSSNYERATHDLAVFLKNI